MIIYVFKRLKDFVIPWAESKAWFPYVFFFRPVFKERPLTGSFYATNAKRDLRPDLTLEGRARAVMIRIKIADDRKVPTVTPGSSVRFLQLQFCSNNLACSV